MKTRPDQKIEEALDEALADTFPASDPVAVLQPTTVGLEESPAPDTRKPGEIKSPGHSIPRAAA
jgi:hypothetical protein